ncbi:hypothetical protein LTR56_028222, partial [Elasticomyces elasticus]
SYQRRPAEPRYGPCYFWRLRAELPLALRYARHPSCVQRARSSDRSDQTCQRNDEVNRRSATHQPKCE